MTTTNPAMLFASRPPRKIAVLRALPQGDMLCVVPALRALRAAAPLSHITLIGLPWATAFVKRFHKYLDDLLVFPGFPGFPEQQAHLTLVPNFLAQAQRQRFAFAIQMHGSGSLSNPLTMLLGAERNAGFYQPGWYCPDPQHFMHWDEREHEVLRYVRLMEFLGIATQGEQLEFPLSDADYRALQRNHVNLPPPDAYVCIHPVARLPQRFAEIADRLAADGMKVVLTGSPGGAEVVREVQRAMRMPSLDLSGKTELGTLAALIAQARLVVSDDAGISHLAAAVATPSVTVSCGSDPQRWAPLDQDRHQVVSIDVECRPGTLQACPAGHQCVQEACAETVSMLAAQVIRNTNPHP